jgi:hypothetical protein
MSDALLDATAEAGVRQEVIVRSAAVLVEYRAHYRALRTAPEANLLVLLRTGAVAAGNALACESCVRLIERLNRSRIHSFQEVALILELSLITWR